MSQRNIEQHKAVVSPFAGDAHAFLVTVYRDTSLPLAVRIDAAKAAIEFEKPVPAPVASDDCPSEDA